MQDKIKSIDNLKLNINKPFNELSINFLDDLSKEIKKLKKIKMYPDLYYLMFWCTKKNILNLKRERAARARAKY